MPHLIETFSNGTAAFAAGRTPAWHRLGTVFDTDMTAEQALTAAQLAGWNVRLANLQAIEITPQGVTTTPANGRYATIRTNPADGTTDVLGVGLSAGYHPVQNEDMAEFISALTDQARISAAGSLRGGTQTFFCCELPHDLLVGGVDRVKHYLAVMNGHDGSMGFRAVVSPVRVVCANTQEMALNSAVQRWSTRHTKGAAKAIEEARRTLELSWRYVEEFETAAQRLTDTSITDTRFTQIITQLLGDPSEPGLKSTGVTRRTNRIDMVRAIYRSDTTRMVAGTAWGAYQALAEYADHADGNLNADRAARRALSAIDGPGATLKQRAYAVLSRV